MASNAGPLRALEPFIGEWSMIASFEGIPPMEDSAHITFEWMPGKRFIIHRWEIPVPEAPNGIAIIGADPVRDGGYLQHYFDERGVARVFKMTIEDRIWRLWRDEPDFSPFDFAQRYTGTFSEDETTITGAWEIRHPGKPWEHDFTLTYTKLG